MSVHNKCTVPLKEFITC